MSVSVRLIGRLGYDALVREARLSPKPGLVDAENDGSHSDMNLALLLKSAEALAPFFQQFAALGLRDAGLPPDGKLAAIRADGIAAEKAMYAATNGVNTHKGAVFLLGVLCYCAGRRAADGNMITPEDLCLTAARVCRGVTSELGGGAGRAFARYGAKGARGEAESGYPNVLAALAAFYTAAARGADEEDGWRIALLELISRVEDANVLARCGEEAALCLRARAGELLLRFPAGGEELSAAIRGLDRQCRTWRASPGGSADLLACAIFLQSLPTGPCESKTPAYSPDKTRI